MTISEILNQIRDRRTCYSKNESFIIPLKWKNVSGTNWAFINKEHARMIAAATGKDVGPGKKIAPHFIYGPYYEFMGVGKNSLTLIKWHDKGVYALRHEHREKYHPANLPESIDLEQKINPPESPDTRPTEMTPEDYYM